jgi:hypothetical protein
VFTSVSFSNPFSCPLDLSQLTFLANRRLPSIIMATCLGISPALRTLLQRFLIQLVFCLFLNQDIKNRKRNDLFYTYRWSVRRWSRVSMRLFWDSFVNLFNILRFTLLIGWNTCYTKRLRIFLFLILFLFYCSELSF